MANKYRTIRSRKKEELLDLVIDDFELEIDIPFPDITKEYLIDLLKDNGVTDKVLRAKEEKQEQEAVSVDEVVPEAGEGQVAIFMERDNASYGYKQYRFHRDQRVALLSEEDAKELIATTSGFRRASVEEVKRYFNL